VARLGPDDASKIVMTISSTHGVEGYCGSGFQVDWLASVGAAGLPRDTAAVMVHAINPYGFAWTRRVTEEGNDLNRNYVDHSKPYPVNEGYLEIADYLIPKDLGEATLKAAEAKLADYRKKVGDVAYFRAVSGGQYSHPDGMFFGGGGPSWSNRTLHAIADKFLKGRSDVAVIDFHTGLGPYGYAEPIIGRKREDPAFARVSAWIGGGGKSLFGDSISAQIKGDSLSAIPSLLPNAEVDTVALECGIRPMPEVAQALRADAWLHAHGDPLSPQAKPINEMLRAAFHSDDPFWQGMALGQGLAACRAALGRLRGP